MHRNLILHRDERDVWDRDADTLTDRGWTLPAAAACAVAAIACWAVTSRYTARRYSTA
jgi:hypothetical protein